MKRNFWKQYSICGMVALAWWGLSGSAALAQWGSVHGNNRSAEGSRAPAHTERREQRVEPARVAPAPAREHEGDR